MNLSAIPFSAALEHLPGLSSGKLVRYGAILKDAQTGKIVGHLQETGLLRTVMEQAPGLLSGANPVGAGLSVFQTIQNEQIKSRMAALESLMGGMKNLQLATLGTSVLGIGVTVASTAIVLHRLNHIGAAVERMEEKIDAIPKVWEEARIRHNLTELRTQLERVEESDVRSDRDEVLRAADGKLNENYNHFSDTALKMSAEITLDADLFRAVLCALSLCGGAQFRVLLALDEKQAAAKRASAQAQQLNQIAWNLPADVMRTKIADKDTALSLTSDLSELRARLSSQPLTAAALIENDLHGREYIERAVAEEEEPLLVLPQA
ncbi:hypothetical protein [Shimia abyssi]|uniref:Uncharacterized protein n=1 Tax=Shimia abyssi TaxID=1662395 RepID=A0A2P8F2X0_9RHOB|nr:hypothetical protein [Shimia abyssi]PSL16052.1 hypothetical protein CLV88_12319 [Shimia abyssi]